MKTYLEFHDEKSSKFWEVTVKDATMITRWGKLGSDGQAKEKTFGSNDEAITEAAKIAGQKVRKGYVPLEDQTSTQTELQSDKSISPEIEKEKVLSFEVLRDHWLRKSFPSITDDEFEEKFNKLLDDTLSNSEDFSPQTRAEVIKNMFKFHDVHLTYNGRYFKDVVNKAKKKFFPAVIEVLSPGFGEAEVTVDILSYATNLEVLDAMLHAGIKPNSKFQSGIDTFTRSGEESKIFKRLVDVGANLDLLVDGEIRTALLDYKYLKQIHEKGVDLNVIDDKECTPIFYCGYADGASKSIKLLKQAGCNIDHVNKDGETALSQAMTAMFPLDECKNLINSGASVHCPPNKVPLITLIENEDDQWRITGLLETVDYLIKQKVSVDERDSKSGNTALHYWAGSDGKIARKICEKLLANGADINALNNAGQTPLQYAAYCHAEKCWKLLLSKKADINARSANGHSASEWAVARGEEPPQSFLKLLLESNAPLVGNDADTDISLLGFLIQNNHYHSAFTVVEHGGEITDWVIDTMTKRSAKGRADALNAITAFIRSVGQRAQEALNTCHHGEIEKLLAEPPKTSSGDPLETLSSKYWPPISPERHPLVVLDVESKALEGKLLFADGEIEEYLNVGQRYVRHNVLDSQSDEKILARISNTRKGKRVAFSEYSRISDKAMIYSWIEVISANEEILEKKRWGSSYGISTDEYRYLLARCGVAVVPSLLEISKKKADIMVRVMQPVADVHVAPLMAKRLSGSPVSRLVRQWLLRHPKHAIHGLIPLAVGKPGKQRDACEAALRYIACQGLKDEIIEIAKAYDGAVLESVQEVLSVDHSIDYHQKELPEIPSHLLKAELSMPLVRETGSILNSDKLPALFGMMSLSSFDDVYPPLQKILHLLDRDTLSEFAWEVFQLWDKWDPGWSEKERKLKKDAEWMFQCLGYMGSDQSIKKLVPLINSWPKSGGMNKAVCGLDILACIRSDFAIRSINGILLKTKYKSLLERAGDIMDTVAEVRGLTKAELDDRLVPTLGLDELDAFALDFGARKFTIEINEKLVPTLVDAENKKIKDLPKPVKADDKIRAKEATAFWKGLKADLKTEAATQLMRFEQAMLSGRQWSIADFRPLLVAHPILAALVRNLVWGEVKNGKIGQLFMANVDGGFVDAKGREVCLPNDATVCIPHPLQIQKTLNTWLDTLVSCKVKQPFSQISRKIYPKREDKNKDLFGINGAKAPAKAFRGLKAKGWMAEIGDGGLVWSYEKHLKGGMARIDFDGVVTMRGHGISEDLTLKVSFSGKPAAVEYSEVVREIKDLLH